VPPPVLWLVQAQVKLLLTKHWSALLHRPESLTVEDDDDDDLHEEGQEGEDMDAVARTGDSGRQGPMQPHELELAHAALRDKTIGPKLQKVLDRLVPSRMQEANFWDNFFSHVDVIKVRLVTDFLTAQDAANAERVQKHETWVQLYDSLESDMKSDLRRAAERIAARQQPPPPTSVELALGLDAHRPPRWMPDTSEAWLEYVEDGPQQVSAVLRAALVARGELVRSEPLLGQLPGGTTGDADVQQGNANGSPAAPTGSASTSSAGGRNAGGGGRVARLGASALGRVRRSVVASAAAQASTAAAPTDATPVAAAAPTDATPVAAAAIATPSPAPEEVRPDAYDASASCSPQMASPSAPIDVGDDGDDDELL
jgi:hypothetical protein